uniref:Reverse transcriptase domain-containing protein n=1 Tax=Aegilops tauschii subsp. strangulata TaxID=200361 RepID=A0A453AA64_AEGTS
SKAFDSVSWDYLLELLQELGFSARWRDWVAWLLSTSSSEFLLNGTAGSRIKHRKGLRQGDPLSPLLFIIAIDPLQRLIDEAITQQMIKPLPRRELK